MRGSFLVAVDRLDEVLAISERGVEAAPSEESRALWQGCVALALLMMGRDLDRAEQAARYAYERLPWVPFVETAWGMVSGTVDGLSATALQIAHGDAAWDPKSFDLERDLALALEKVGYATNAIDPDLRAFKARGGKLLLYHGWNDGLISAGNTVNYYDSVIKTMGRGQEDWLRLFMVPGMGH